MTNYLHITIALPEGHASGPVMALQAKALSDRLHGIAVLATVERPREPFGWLERLTGAKVSTRESIL